MQGEIKIRGKRVDNGEWVYGCPVKDWSGNTYIITEFGCRVTTCSDCGMPIATYYEVITETVGQYTGLKDKNGKEIYEGDIVHCTELRNDKISEYISEVFLDDGCWLVHESKTCDVELYLFENRPTKLPLTEIGVIGNIFDNPELLQEVEC